LRRTVGGSWMRAAEDGAIIIIIIISLLMSPLLGHRPSLWITQKENEDEARWRAFGEAYVQQWTVVMIMKHTNSTPGYTKQ
jgi:hypothetical protein